MSSPGPLTSRETEILRLVAEGRPNRQVAKILWVTEQTIKFHLANIYRKLGVRNRIEASRWAQIHILPKHRPDDPESGPDIGVREPRRPIKPSLIDGIALKPPNSTDELDTDQDAPSQAA
jgi:DNA-binding CsgD family transcriptional regulator